MKDYQSNKSGIADEETKDKLKKFSKMIGGATTDEMFKKILDDQ